jgi:hypothetical protein
MCLSIFSMTSSCAGEEIAATTFISLPHFAQSSGFSNHALAMSRAQFFFLARTNSLSESSVALGEGGLSVVSSSI